MLSAQDRRFTLNTQPSHEVTMTTFIYTVAIGLFGIPLAFMTTIFLIEQIDPLYRIFQEALIKDLFLTSFLNVPYMMIILTIIANIPKSSFIVYCVCVLSLIISILVSFYGLETKIKIDYSK